MFFAKKKDIVGIDIGSSSIKLVQLKEQKGVFLLQSVGVIPLPPEAIVADYRKIRAKDPSRPVLLRLLKQARLELKQIAVERKNLKAQMKDTEKDRKNAIKANDAAERAEKAAVITTINSGWWAGGDK